MIILLALHMLQVIIDGAYRAPREVNFWIGLVLLNLVLALSLTGYLLPWDQKGYWSTKVATNLMAIVPGVGPSLQRLVVGGAGLRAPHAHAVLRLHAGLLPMLMMVFIGVHVYVFRRHGLRHKEPQRAADTHFWPDQVLKDAVACLGVLLVVLLLVFRFRIIPGGADHVGAELAAPADPSRAVRRGAAGVVLPVPLPVPQAAVLRRRERGLRRGRHPRASSCSCCSSCRCIGRWRVGHWFNVAFTMFLAAGMVLLTADGGARGPGRAAAATRRCWRRSGRTFGIVLLSVLLLAALVLVPLFARERSFRFNMIVLGSLLVLVGFAVRGRDGRRRAGAGAGRS